MTKVRLEDILPVSPPQTEILEEESRTGRVSPPVQFVVDLDGVPQMDYMNAALKRLVLNYQGLRSIFLYRGMKRPLQAVLREVRLTPNSEDLSRHIAEVGNEVVFEWLRRDRKKTMPPDQSPTFRWALLKLGPDRFKMVWTFHPAVIDDWSFQLLLTDFWRFYAIRESGGGCIGLRSQKTYHRYLERQGNGMSRQSWDQYLLNPPQQCHLPGCNTRRLDQESIWRRFTAILGQGPAQDLRERAGELGVSVDSFLFGVWGFLLMWYGGTEEVIFLAGTHGRDLPGQGLSRIVGHVASFIPVRVKAGEGEPFWEVASRIDEHLRRCKQFGHFTPRKTRGASEHCLRVTGERTKQPKPVCMPENLRLAAIEKWEIPPNNHLDFYWEVDVGESLSFSVSYQASLFEEGIIERVAGEFLFLIRKAVENPGATIRQLTVGFPVRHRQSFIARLQAQLSFSLPPYMIPSRFMLLDHLPLGPTGKLDRRLLTDPGMVDSGTGVQSFDSGAERRLRDIWSEVLSIPSKEIRRDSDFFNLGGHSLRAVRLCNAIERAFQVRLKIQTIFRSSNLAAMAKEIIAVKDSFIDSIRRLEPKPYYELSYAQRRIWILSRLNPGSSAFNMPVAVPVFGRPLDRKLVERALKLLSQRHEALRTYFAEREQDVVQIIENETNIPLKYWDLSGLEEKERNRECRQLLSRESERPFDLQNPPLFRALMVKVGEERHHLLFNMHHIISDGWSLQVLQREFIALYDAEAIGREVILPPLRIQYRDYAHWHNRLLENTRFAEEADSFWRLQLTGQLSTLDLPYDFPQNRDRPSDGAGFRTFIPNDVTLGLNLIGREHRASLFMVMLAAMNITLSFLRGQQDIIIGIAGAARQHDDLKYVMGLFVNTLIMRSDIHKDEAFDQYLARVKDKALKTLEYQSYPMELVCQRLGIQYPRLNVFFNMLNLGEGDAGQMPDAEDRHLPEIQDNKFPLTIYISEYANGIEILCTYLRELFQPVTVQKIVSHYRTLLTAIAHDPRKRIKEYKTGGKKKSLKRKKEC